VPLVSTAAAPATAQTITGQQAFHGFLLVDGTHGTRDVVKSPIVAKGIFDGVGRIVEVANRPGDPNNVTRDNLVFRVGTMHIVNKNLKTTFSLDPKTCKVQAHIDQRGRVTGGTRAFRDAFGSFRGTVDATARLARKANGACNTHAAPLREKDVVSAKGFLTY
jgi:hypothetical protein